MGKITFVSSHTAALLENYLASPSHALGLIGPPGSGKGHVAKQLAHHLLGNRLNEQTLLVVRPQDGSIGVDTARSLKRFLSLVQPGDSAIRRVLIIEDADRMTDEAQNAILKAIEEPPLDAVCIVTSRHEDMLLPTILSRLQRINVLPLTMMEAQTFFADASPTKLEQKYHLSGGGSGLLYALLQGDEHPLQQSTETAKRILAATTFERLCMIDELAKGKDALVDTFYCLKRIVSLSVRSKDPAKYARMTKAILAAEDDTMHSVQTKLLLTKLFLAL